MSMDDELSTHPTMVRGPTTSSTGSSNKGRSTGDKHYGVKKQKGPSTDGDRIINNNNKRTGKTKGLLKSEGSSPTRTGQSKEEVEVHDKSVHKFIRTFRNGDYDQEFDDALSSERSAVVPNTRPTQASYNNLTIGEKGIELD